MRLFFFLLGIFLSPAWLQAKGKEVKIALFDFCPWQCPDLGEPQRPGIIVEAAKAIFKEAGYRVQFFTVPYARAIKGTEEGDYDVILNLNAHTSQKLLLSEESSAYIEMNFYLRKDDLWHYKGIPSLKSIQIISIIGYDYSPISPSYQKYISENENTGKVVFLSGDNASERAFRMVLEKRATTFNEAASVFEYSTLKAGIRNQFKKGETLGGGPLYAGFTPRRTSAKTFRNVFDKGIIKLRESGALKKILDHYGVSDWRGNKKTIMSQWD